MTYQNQGTSFSLKNKSYSHNKTYGECKNVILFTNARNEKHIKEWVAHHLLIGFSAICIFDHKSNPPVGPEFVNFDKRVKVIRVEYDNPVKLKLMSMAVTIAKQNAFDWLLYLDADEFLVLNSFAGVKKMLTHFKYADALSINWLMFGTNHHIKEPSGLILENYTKSQLKPDKHVKTFVRPDEVIGCPNPHWFNIYRPNRIVSITNKVMQNSDGVGYAFNPCNANYNKLHAYIAHYVYQAEETYVKRKINLDADDGTGKREKDPSLHKKYNDVDNFGPKNKYAKNINAFLQRFS